MANIKLFLSGVVVSKEYYPEKTYYYQLGNILVPMRRSETYCLEIENNREKDTFAISKAEYEKYEIGDDYLKEW